MEETMKLLLVAFFVFLGAIQSFALGAIELVNSQTIDMTLVDDLTVSYSSDNVFLFESNDDNLILKEFMTRNNQQYYAKISKSKNAIAIINGKRPWFIRTRIEIYIPKTDIDNLNINLRSGNLTGNYTVNHKNVNITVSSGNIRMENLVTEVCYIA
jgi:hypothetical protein